MVGYGPAVSEDVTVQDPEVVVPDVLPDELLEEEPESFLQANGAMMPSPNAARPLFKNIFLSILGVLVKKYSCKVYDTHKLKVALVALKSPELG